MAGTATDRYARPMRDLRISVTDRCNFRCVYCMPKEVFGQDYPFLERGELLTFEEIDRLARVFVALGVNKIRLTGGEPLMRRQLHSLIAMLSGIEGLDDLTLTTNGSALTESKAVQLREAGLKRLTVSLDSLDDRVFSVMNDVHFPVQKVLGAVEAAVRAGLSPVKVNMVVRRGLNEGGVVEMARRFKGTGTIVRFIEYMDVGSSNGWRMDEVVSASEISTLIGAQMPIEPVDPNYRGEVAQRWRYQDGQGEIGIISSVTHPFCRDCSRARLSADGKLYTCLFATQGRDLKRALRQGGSDSEISDLVSSVWGRRDDRYSEIRSESSRKLPKVEMSYIGG